MLDHVSVTVSNLVSVERFYDAIFFALGIYKVGSDVDDAWIGYGHRADEFWPDRTYFSVRLGPKPEPAARRHWCFKASTRQQVDEFWQAGLEQGGVCNRLPGLRPAYHRSYYAAFLVDPDGNQVEAVCHRVEEPGKGC